MNKKTSLLLGLHCHQPVDNFSEVVDDAIEKSYRAFFQVASLYPEFKFSLHYSGWLLEYIKKNDKETFALMQKLAKNGSIEFFSGGYYEPILASIPSKDRIEQIKMLNSFIKKNFNQKPKGLWLTERVWDSTIIKDLAKCDIEYVLVDDYHFLSAGFKRDSLNGYYITEDDGVAIKIFPINQNLRYILPFKAVDDVTEYLANLKTSRGGAGIVFDDGEKFGIWPKTYEWVYEKKWLNSFIEKTLEHDEIEPKLYSEYIKEQKPLGIAYLPTTSYYEMGEWSLRADDALCMEKMKKDLKTFANEDINRFVKGSIWKNFFVKYPESNHIHKRVLELSKNQLKSKSYKTSLFKAQTNDTLWHGVFGGLYLPNLRDNAYKFIIECENERYKKDKLYLEIEDNNFDGYEEVKAVNKNFIALFDSKTAGQLVELDLRDKKFNFLNTLSRYKEAYHDKIVNPPIKQKSDIDSDEIDTIHSLNIENLDKYREMLKFDWYRKSSFIDHITDFSVNIDNFDNNTFREYSDFANQPFKIEDFSNNSVTFKREGGIYTDRKIETSLTKSYTFDENSIVFDIDLEVATQVDFNYLMEMNLHFANLKDVKLNSKFIENKSIITDKKISITDSYTQKEIVFKLEKEIEVFVTRLDTLSQSEKGFDSTNQGITLAFKTPFDTKLNFKGKVSIVDIEL